MPAIECPACKEDNLVQAKNERFRGLLPLDEEATIKLECLRCHTKFRFRMSLSRIKRGRQPKQGNADPGETKGVRQ